MHTGAAPPEFHGTAETRLVFARLRGEVVYMADGEAETFRQHKGELRCLLPGCPYPDLTVVNRGDTRRHGFRHLTAVEHPGMGVHHLQAQLLVAQWLRERYERSSVQLEETTEDGRRRADVMITAPGGQQAAFEIQYSPMTFDSWKERHESYQAAGIVDVWLWGHTTPHLDGSNNLSALLSQVARVTGRPLLWVNPELGQLATAAGTDRVGSDTFEVPLRRGKGRLEVLRLEDLHLTASGLRSSRLDELMLGIVARDAKEREMWMQMLLRLAKEELSRRTRQAQAPARTTRRSPPFGQNWVSVSSAEPLCTVCGEPATGVWTSSGHSRCLQQLADSWMT